MSVVSLIIFFDIAMLYLIVAALFGLPLWGAFVAGAVGLALMWAVAALGQKYG